MILLYMSSYTASTLYNNLGTWFMHNKLIHSSREIAQERSLDGMFNFDVPWYNACNYTDHTHHLRLGKSMQWILLEFTPRLHIKLWNAWQLSSTNYIPQGIKYWYSLVSAPSLPPKLCGEFKTDALMGTNEPVGTLLFWWKLWFSFFVHGLSYFWQEQNRSFQEGGVHV